MAAQQQQEQKRPPVWQLKGFASLLCDNFIEGTELAGGSLGPAVSLLCHVVDRILATQPQQDPNGGLAGTRAACLSQWAQEDLDALEGTKQLFVKCAQISEMTSKVEKPEQFHELLEKWNELMNSVNVGDTVIVPGGWVGQLNQSSLVYVLERTSENLFDFVVCNSGAGLEYHPSCSEDVPKTKFETCLRLASLPRDRITDPGFWSLLFSMFVGEPSEYKRVEVIYDVLLPWLAGTHTLPEVFPPRTDPSIEYRTAQRGGGGGWRCAVEAMRYILRHKFNITTPQLKQFTYALRREMLVFAMEDVRGMAQQQQTQPPALRPVDRQVITLACQQFALVAVKEMKAGNMSGTGATGLIDAKTVVEKLLTASGCGGKSGSGNGVALETLDAESTQLDDNDDENVGDGDDNSSQHHAVAGIPPALNVTSPSVTEQSTGFKDVSLLLGTNMDSYAGDASDPTSPTPADFLQVPRSVTSITEAMRALVACDQICQSLLQRSTSMSFSSKVSLHYQVIQLIGQLFTDVLPVPTPSTYLEDTAATATATSPTSSSSSSSSSSSPSPACIWTSSDPVATIDKAGQLQVLELVHRLMLTYGTVWQSMEHPSRSFDSERSLVSSCMLAVYDAVVRRRASDNPLGLSELLWEEGGFAPSLTVCIDNRPFADASSTMELSSPQLAETRCKVLRYFTWLRARCTNELFRFRMPDKIEVLKYGATLLFLRRLLERCGYEVMPRDDGRRRSEMEVLMDWLLSEETSLATHESGRAFHMYRDVACLFKFLTTMETKEAELLSKRAAPREWQRWELSFDSEQRYRYWGGGRGTEILPLTWEVVNFRGQDQSTADIQATGLGGRILRFGEGPMVQSPCDASSLLDLQRPTEEDILHADTLPSYGNTLSQEESELLMSYLTVPYARIPLVMSFFASRDRVTYLFNEKLQQLLRAVVFESGAWVDDIGGVGVGQVKRVPVRRTRDESEKEAAERFMSVAADREYREQHGSAAELLATAPGLLLNELRFSPSATLDALLAMLGSIPELSKASVWSPEANFIMYLIRLAVDVEGYVVAAIQKHSSASATSSSFGQEQAAVLTRYHAALREFFHGSARGVLDRYLQEAEEEEDLPTMCVVHSYLALLYRNVDTSTFQSETVTAIIGHLAFVTNWHGFGLGQLRSDQLAPAEGDNDVQERLVRFLQAQGINTNTIKEGSLDKYLTGRPLWLHVGREVIRCPRLSPPDASGVNMARVPPADLPEHELFDMLQCQRRTLVQFMNDSDATTRGVVLSGVLRIALRSQNTNLDWVMQGSGRFFARRSNLTVDVQTAEVLWRNDALKPVPDSMVQFSDFESVFGRRALHCGMVRRQEHRLWVHVMGTDCDLREWDAPDPKNQGVGMPIKPSLAPPGWNTAAQDVEDNTTTAADSAAASRPKYCVKGTPNCTGDCWTCATCTFVNCQIPGIFTRAVCEMCAQPGGPAGSAAAGSGVAGVAGAAGGGGDGGGEEDGVVYENVHYKRPYDPYEDSSEQEHLDAGEKWIFDILGPVLRAVYPQASSKMPYTLLLPADAKSSGDGSVARLVGCDAQDKKDATWKEVTVHRARGVVHVYNLLTHGRRMYRSLIYSSNAPFALHGLTPSAVSDGVAVLSPEVCYAGGDMKNRRVHSPSLVISRHRDDADGVAITEVYLPPRLLQGVLPSALLESFQFWQETERKSDGSNGADPTTYRLRGYPVVESGDGSGSGSGTGAAAGGGADAEWTQWFNYDVDVVFGGGVGGSERTVTILRRPRTQRAVSPHNSENSRGLSLSSSAVYDERLAVQETADAMRHLIRSNDNAISGNAGSTTSESQTQSETAVSSLCALGFSAPACRLALRLNGADCNLATEWLLNSVNEEAIAAEEIEAMDRMNATTASLNMDVDEDGGGGSVGGGNGDVEMATDVTEPSDSSTMVVELPTSPSPSPSVSKKDLPTLLMADLVRAEEGSPLHSMATVLARVEDLSHVLVWCRRPNTTSDDDDVAVAEMVDIVLVELPRLKVRLLPKTMKDGQLRFCLEGQLGWFVSDRFNRNRAGDGDKASSAEVRRVSNLVNRLSHCLILENRAGELQIMVPNHDIHRPRVKGSPFSSMLAFHRLSLGWQEVMETRYYLYPVHTSLSFLLTPTLASALYLIALRLMTRQYRAAFRLIETCTVDVEFTSEEDWVFCQLARSVDDRHPDALACRLKLLLAVAYSPNKIQGWEGHVELDAYMSKYAHVSADCRLSLEEEYQAVHYCKQATPAIKNRTLYLEAIKADLALSGRKTSPSVLERLGMGRERTRDNDSADAAIGRRVVAKGFPLRWGGQPWTKLQCLSVEFLNRSGTSVNRLQYQRPGTPNRAAAAASGGGGRPSAIPSARTSAFGGASPSDMSTINQAMDTARTTTPSSIPSPAPVTPAFPATPWSCPTCTFKNEATTNLCQICSAQRPRPITGTGAAGGASAAPLVDWNCGTCTFRNAGSAAFCTLCNAAKPAEVAVVVVEKEDTDTAVDTSASTPVDTTAATSTSTPMEQDDEEEDKAVPVSTLNITPVGSKRKRDDPSSPDANDATMSATGDDTGADTAAPAAPVTTTTTTAAATASSSGGGPISSPFTVDSVADALKKAMSPAAAAASAETPAVAPIPTTTTTTTTTPVSTSTATTSTAGATDAGPSGSGGAKAGDGPRALSYLKEVDCIKQLVWDESLIMDEESGSNRQLGVLFLYEVLTGRVALTLCDRDCSRTMGELLTRYFHLKQARWGRESVEDGEVDAGASRHIASLAVVIAQPYHAWPDVLSSHTPEYECARILGRGIDLQVSQQEQMGFGRGGVAFRGGRSIKETRRQVLLFLDNLYRDTRDVLQTPSHHQFLTDVNRARERVRADPPDRECLVAVEVVDETLYEQAPGYISDYGCPSRPLPSQFRVSDTTGKNGNSDTASFHASRPLSVLGLDLYVAWQAAVGEGSDTTSVSRDLPFDLSQHPAAQPVVAQDMLRRLANDVAGYADTLSAKQVPYMRTLHRSDIEAICCGDGIGAQKTADALAALRLLRSSLSELVCADMTRVRQLDGIIRDQSLVTPDLTRTNDVDTDALSFILRRFGGQRVSLSMQYVTSILMSTTASDDLLARNPYLSAAAAMSNGAANVAGKTAVDGIFISIVTLLFHSNRLSQARRAIDGTDRLVDMLSSSPSTASTSSSSSSSSSSPSSSSSSKGKQLVQMSNSLAECLCSDRHYITSGSDTDGDVDMDGGSGASTFDPRFLVFEYVFDVLLRKRQVEMVRSFSASLAAGGSAVQQMIMGAGKTTVIGPLLTLMMADGKSLVTQVMPTALLEMSRSVLRSRFSTGIISKRVYTLQFDRSCEDDVEVVAALFAKLDGARRHGDVVCATPEAIKSLLLKYIEQLHAIEQVDPDATYVPGQSARKNREVTRMRDQAIARSDMCDGLVRILQLWKSGVLVMDEVDVLLHPLRSELNFPIGEKYPIDLAGSRWDLPIHLIDAVFYVQERQQGLRDAACSEASGNTPAALAILDRLYEAVSEGYRHHALQKQPHLVLLDTAFYHSTLKPVFAEWALEWMMPRLIGHVDATAATMLKYLMGVDVEECREEIESGLSSESKKLLNLAADWIRSLLPHVLSKINRVSFGLLTPEDLARADGRMPNGRQVMAVPFVGKDVPSRASEFAHVDVLIGLSVLAYRYEGVRPSDLRRVVVQLKQDFSRQVGPREERPACLQFQEWLDLAQQQCQPQPKKHLQSSGQDVVTESTLGVLPLPLFQPGDVGQMTKLFGALHRLPSLQHYYLRQHVFPACMNFQRLKISACGHELGSNILFGRRIGFSGTPSNLLPLDLGDCEYEPGSDGKVVNVLTSPRVTTASTKRDWTAESLLRDIATQEPPAHALIDTGALITGMQNNEVARYLLTHLPSHTYDGVVYLDRSDRQMVLLRSNPRRPVALAQCGIDPIRRFTFYDQVHTTGMDIKQTPNACAVLTIGKDMTFRDYAQGAYRMRGIGCGQTIHLYLIPEVQNRIQQDLVTRTDRPEIDVPAWLLINGMRLESIQFVMLSVQELHNVWRKTALSSLCSEVECNAFAAKHPSSQRLRRFTSASAGSEPNAAWLRTCVEQYREEVGHSVADCVPVPRPHAAKLKELVQANSSFVRTDDESSAHRVLTVLTKVEQVSGGMAAHGGGVLARQSLESEVVHENEQEEEAEEEAEEEEQKESAFTRDDEQQNPWDASLLLHRPTCDPSDGDSTIPGNGGMFADGGDEAFYQMARFRVNTRHPLVAFPQSLLVSDNFFRPRWAGLGDRRLKNVALVFDWTPTAAAAPPVVKAKVYDSSKTPIQSLQSNLVHLHAQMTRGCGRPACNHPRCASNPSVGPSSDATAAATDAVKLLTASAKSHEVTRALLCMYVGQAAPAPPPPPSSSSPPTRYLVAVSLAEGETLRRAIHSMQESRGTSAGHEMTMALRSTSHPPSAKREKAPSGVTHLPPRLVREAAGTLLDASCGGFEEISTTGSDDLETVATSVQCLRFLNSEMFFTDVELELLRRGLASTPLSDRVLFFAECLRLRRRERNLWGDTPLAKLFTAEEEWHMLSTRAKIQQASVALRLYERKHAHTGSSVGDLFSKMDSNNDSCLTYQELQHLFETIQLGFSPHDIVDIVKLADPDSHGHVSRDDFASVFGIESVRAALAPSTSPLSGSAADKNATAYGGMQEDDDMWMCSNCTFRNSVHETACVMCNTGWTGRREVPRGMWSCVGEKGGCTFFNPNKSFYCEVCDRARPDLASIRF